MAVSPRSNPIIRGFSPDPSICRVGDDYYIATSTFEWYPGVRIYHSRNLRDWTLAGRPLNRPDLLDMTGNPDSCGVWAPCLSYSDGLFYLLYTDVRRFDGNFKDTHNYLVTSPSIDGDWSERVYLNSSGFDPSLFHDDDGRKWYTNMVWDHRPDRSRFAGIALQEYSVERQALIGERRFVFEGSGLGCTEGPHLYKRDGYYYLITAEGGTGYGHAATMARSRQVGGPYELDPAGPLVSSRSDPEWPLQRAGHADIVESPDGDLFSVFLVSRPLPQGRYSPLGRETALARLEYTADGWYRSATGSPLPPLEVELPASEAGADDGVLQQDDFAAPELDPDYQWLRSPDPSEFLSLTDRPGWLRLYGMESPGSLFRQALIARRQTEFRFQATTLIDFEPQNFQQLAGLILYYNSSKFHYLYLSRDEAGRHLGIMSCEGNPALEVSYPLGSCRVPLPDGAPVYLRACGEFAELRFQWSRDGVDWQSLPATLDLRLLSDEVAREGTVNFTGTFIGLCCNDLTGARQHADFDFFTLENTRLD